MSKSNETTPNVPTLRFYKNGFPWKKKRLKDFCVINPRTEDLDEEFVYIDLESVSKGVLLSENIISKDGAPSRAQRVLENNDILFQCVRPYQMNNLFFRGLHNHLQYVASTGYAQIRTKEYPPFVYHLLHSPNFNKNVMLRCTGSSYPAIASGDLEDIETFICDKEEQQKIGLFLDAIDHRIAVQNKIISKYESLIKGLCYRLCGSDKTCKLSDLVSCNTSVLQENEINDNGLYPVWGASGIVGYLDSFQFGKDAILVLKDGSKVGKVQFAAGKYSVVGTSVVLIPKSAEDAKYLYFSILTIDFDKYKVGSGIPHIYFKDYSTEQIYFPDKERREKIVKLLNGYERKMNIEKEMLSALQRQKAFLLKTMFI